MRLIYCIRDDATGKGIQDGSIERPDWDKAALRALVQSNQPAGRTVVDVEARPHPAHDAPAIDFTRVGKRERLAALRLKGWAALTLTEKDEARTLAFDLGEPSPPAV